MRDAPLTSVLFEELPSQTGLLGIITLNRPEVLNALNGEMAKAILQQLLHWQNRPEIQAVVIQGAGDRAFCAGGDLKLVYQAGPKHIELGIPFFRAEYLANLLIHNYSKPYIALLDGIAMGGGLGISIHGTRVVATEHLKLAMPETAIGLYPDVGAGYFFARSPHKIGLYLGLSGVAIGVADAMLARLVHAHVPRSKVKQLIPALAARDLSTDCLATIDEVIAEFKQNPGPNTLAAHAQTIEQCFSQSSIEDILQALEHSGDAWALEQLEILRKRSPTSLKVAYKELTLSVNRTLAECMETELNLTIAMMQEHDVYEGIRAVLIEKTHDPKWQPARLQDVSDAHIEAMFELKCKL